MEFEFRATNSTTVAILKRWNIVLMESIAANCGDPEQMNYIGKVLNRQATDSTDLGSRLTKSFRKRSQSTKEKQSSVKRSGSFSGTKSATLRPEMLGVDTPSPQSTSVNSSPLKPAHQAPSSSSSLAGEVVAAARPNRMQSSPPPLPPRPILDDSSSEGDPDYAYIEEDEVKGPAHSPSLDRGEGGAGERTLDEQLEDLELSMRREKKEKKRRAAQEKRRAATMAVRPTQLRPPLFFTPADPEDYMEPLSCLSNGRPRSTGETPLPAHTHSFSEPDTSFYPDSKSLSQPTINTFRYSPPHLSPTPELHETPPTLPSRAWRVSLDDSDISPYAVVRKVLTGKILEEPDAGKSGAQRESPTTAEQRRLSKTSQQEVHSPESDPKSPSSDAANTTGGCNEGVESAPPIPPRSPIKEKLSWGSSTSSVASTHSLRSGHAHSAGVRCSKCQRQRRAPVDKTLSENRGHPSPHPVPPLHHPEKSSLPDLNNAAAVGGVPENALQHRRQRSHRGRLESATESRSSSDGSTSSLQSYLEIVPDSTAVPQNKGRNSDPENLQILDDFLQYFDDKVSSLTQPEGSPELQKHHTLVNTPPHSNGFTPPRRTNGVKDPPTLQRSHTSASFISHAQSRHPANPTKNHSFNNSRPAPPPPAVPPRSDISLQGRSGVAPHYPPINHHQPLHATGYHHRLWGRSGSSGSFSSTSGDSRSPPSLYSSRTRQSSSSSIHSGTPSPTIVPPPHPPRSWQHLARHFTQVPPEGEGSSTVFIHHLKHDRRVMHSHMV